MTVGQDPQPPRHEGAVGALAEVSTRLITVLPPAFLLLVIINIVFGGLMVWFINNQATQRAQLVGDLVHRCLEIALQKDPLPPHGP
jgi:hypothetical protein